MESVHHVRESGGVLRRLRRDGQAKLPCFFLVFPDPLRTVFQERKQARAGTAEDLLGNSRTGREVLNLTQSIGDQLELFFGRQIPEVFVLEPEHAERIDLRLEAAAQIESRTLHCTSALDQRGQIGPGLFCRKAELRERFNADAGALRHLVEFVACSREESDRPRDCDKRCRAHRSDAQPDPSCARAERGESLLGSFEAGGELVADPDLDERAAGFDSLCICHRNLWCLFPSTREE